MTISPQKIRGRAGVQTPEPLIGIRVQIRATSWQNQQNVHPAKTQISLGVPPVWSEFSLSAWRKLGSLAIYWAHSEDSDQTRRMSRLIWVFAGRTCHFVGFVMRWLSSDVQPTVLPRLAENDEVVMGGNFFLQFNYVSAKENPSLTNSYRLLNDKPCDFPDIIFH